MSQLFALQHDLPSLSVAAQVAGVLAVTLFLLRHAATILSFILDVYLRWLKPIVSEDGRTSLPTCPYQWPNGQGDQAKFLEGVENRGEWEEQYGKIYSIWSGFNREIVLTNAKQLEAVFRDSDKHFKAENNNSGYLMSELLGQCVGLLSREQWRPLRSVTEVPFQHQEMRGYVDMVAEHVRRHFDLLHQSTRMSMGRIHPTHDLKMLPFWIVAELLYGRLDDKDRAELLELSALREHLFKMLMQGGLVRWRWSRFLPTATNGMLSEFQRRWSDFNHAAWARAMKQGDRLPIVSMMEAVAAGTISKKQVLQTIDEALFANLDVTTGGISWNVVFLAAHPEVQAQIRADVANATDSRAYSLSSSTLAAACILESARLKPLAAFSVPQSASTDRVVGGYVIPARTDFIVDTYALNVENPFWGPDRKKYRPSRFLERRAIEMRYQYWRFGFGPRQCMGRYLADLIMRVLVVHLAQNYELSWLEKTMGENADWARDMGSWITLPEMELCCTPRKDSNAA